MVKHTKLGATAALIFSAVVTTPASALPSLQLGPDCDPAGSSTCDDWSYVGGGDDTWYYNGTQPFTLNAYANAPQTDDGIDNDGNGDYAWAIEPDPDQYAYLVAATVPDLGAGDKFDLSVIGGTLVASGYGAPPVEDPNSLQPHSIFDTYFEVYEFQFDGPIVDIENTQPPGGDPGKGFIEGFSITLNSSDPNLTGIHFDLFTVASGQYTTGGLDDKKLVQAFAPFSHDAQLLPPGTPPPPPPAGVPEPSILALFGIGMVGMGLMRRRRIARLNG